MHHANINTPVLPMTTGFASRDEDHASRFGALFATMITVATGLGVLVGLLIVAIIAVFA